MSQGQPIARRMLVSDFAMTHCRRCVAGWTRTIESGALAVVCLLDREPVPPNLTSCNRYELRED
jgi:hypothetical protein